MPDHREVNRVHLHALGQRLEDRRADDDGRNGVEEAADHEEHERDEEAGGGKAHAPGLHAGQDRFRDFVIGEKPAEATRGADTKERDAGELAGVEQRRVEALHVHLAIDEKREERRIEHGDAGGFGGGEPAENLAADDDARRHQRGNRDPQAQKN